jgi:hypothetical protein
VIELRRWLRDKRDRGVTRVSVSVVLEKIDELTTTNASRSASGFVRVGPGDLIGVYEAAKLLGVDRTRPTKWRSFGTTFGPDKIKFPEPIAELEGAPPTDPTKKPQRIPVFLRAEVEKLQPYVEERRRKKKPTNRR